jgi:hypothetical protein
MAVERSGGDLAKAIEVNSKIQAELLRTSPIVIHALLRPQVENRIRSLRPRHRHSHLKLNWWSTELESTDSSALLQLKSAARFSNRPISYSKRDGLRDAHLRAKSLFESPSDKSL